MVVDMDMDGRDEWIKDPSDASKRTLVVLSHRQLSHGKVLGRGTVDVRATLESIKSGRLGARDVFQNREGLLPPARTGYYEEFVHPTPGVTGVGPQRIIQGRGGELYYTPDLYKTFIPLN